MEQPTLSPQSNRLIEMCEAVMTGQADISELSELLDEMYKGLEKARQDFISQANKQGKKYLEQMQEEMKLVLESFDEYQQGLDGISLYLQGRNVQYIKDGVPIIIDATNNILDYLTVYESKSLQLGPTSFPILNMLILLTETYNKGELGEDEFRFMIHNATEFFNKIIDEFEGYEGDEAIEAIETLKEGYHKFVDGLDKMDEGAKAHNELLLEDALEIIKSSQEIMKSGYMKFQDEMFLSGPTASPYDNLMLSTIEGHKKGVFPKDILIENLEKYEEEIISLRIDVEGLLSIPHENPAIDDEAPRTEQAFDLLEEAIDEIKCYFQDDDMSHLDIAAERIKEGSNILEESRKVYDDIGEREGKVACVRCGNLNDQGSYSCTQCNAMLPKIMEGAIQSTFTVQEGGEIGTGIEQDFMMTENLKKLVDASAAVRDGRIEFDEYEKTLNWMERILKTSLQEMEAGQTTINIDAFAEEDRELAGQQKEMIDDTVSLMMEGINDFLEG